MLLTTYPATDTPGDIVPGRREEGQRVFESQQKTSKSIRNARKKFYFLVHTQEVTGSSPAVSIKKSPISLKLGTFYDFFEVLLVGQVVGQAVTHYLTHYLKAQKITGQHRL